MDFRPMTTTPLEETIEQVPTPRLSVLEAFRLQITPGIASLALFLPAAYVLHERGLPVIFALGVGILLGEVPVTWWLMIRRMRAEEGGFSFSRAFPWMRKLRWRVYLLAGIPIVLVSMALMMMGQMVLSPVIQEAAFPFAPEWMHMTMSPNEMAALDQSVLLAMWAMSIVIFTGIGGFTQELYARGFLLPRMAHMGVIAPVLNALFFAMMHLAGPWGWPVFFVTSLIWAVAVFWTRSVKIGLVGHIGMLFVQSMMMGALIFASA